MSANSRSPPDLQRDNRGVSEVVGVILILGFTILVATSVMAVGATMISEGQQSTENSHAENELSMFGSKVADVGLGDSNVQSASFSGDNGEYEVREDEGWIKIEHVEWNGQDTEVLGKETVDLGAVVYTNGDTETVYQGGGVWSHKDGHTSMVSPPEFHYRSGTLTLPIISVKGDSQSSGNSQASINPTGDTKTIYPDRKTEYEGSSTPYVNPVSDGHIEVTVHSKYYKGWEQYFKERTTGDVEVNDAEEKVTVELITLGDQGHTELENGGKINLRGMPPDEDPMDDFTLTLAGDGSSGLNNMDWTLNLEGEEFINLHQSGSWVDVTIVAEDGTRWTAHDAFEVHGTKSDQYVEVNLTSTDTDHYVSDGIGETDDKPLKEAFNQRLEKHAPNADLIVEDANGAQRVNHDNSHAHLDYGEGSHYITFLHITENEIEVELS